MEAVVGRGGMGAVYRARDPRFRRTVAVKVLSGHLLPDDQFRARFDREARVVAALEHPAIVPVYDYGEEDGEPYLVFRYMEGGNLAERIAKDGQLPFGLVRAIAQRLAEALDYAHGEGVIHRDVKPANVVFDRAGNAYLTDFGIAAMTVHTVSLTGLGTIGSPAYMSPEQCDGKPATAASDVYSLGCTVFEALTARPPFQAENHMALLLKHIREEPPLVSAYRPDIARELDAGVARALAKEPGMRPQQALAFASAIAAAPAEGERAVRESGAEPAAVEESPEAVEPSPVTRLMPAPVPVASPHDLTQPLAPVTPELDLLAGPPLDGGPEPSPASEPAAAPGPAPGLRAPRRFRPLLAGGIAALVAVAAGLVTFAAGLWGGGGSTGEAAATPQSTGALSATPRSTSSPAATPSQK